MSLGLALITVTSCHKRVLKGNGNTASETRTLSEFSKIESNGSTNITVVKDTKYSVIVTGYSNLVPLFETEVRGDRLIIQYKERFWNVKNDNITIEVHTPYLDKATLNGSGNVDIRSGFDQERFDAKISGSGKIKSTGSKYFVMDADINGSGDINTEGSEIEKVYANISGSGTLYVKVNQYLQVDISGSGKVYYSGNPGEVKQDISGSGEIRKR